MELKLYGAIIEMSSPEQDKELIEFLASSLETATFYERIFQPGVIYNTVFDWMAIINLTGSAITIGHALWESYKRIILSRKEKNPESNAKLIFQLQDEQKNIVQVVLGDEFKSGEEFLPEFQRRVENTFKQGEKGEVNIKKVVEESLHWRRIK
jgi:hypothetical protein